MSDKEKEIKKLEFICPECGCCRLECVEENAIVTSEITELNDSGDFEYGQPQILVEGEKDLYFQCLDCGYVIKDETGHLITGNFDLVEWLENQK